MNRATVGDSKAAGEFGNTPVSKVISMVLGIILVMAFILSVFFRDEGVVLQHDVRSLGFVEVDVDETGFACRRHIGPNNEIGPCPDNWEQYRQVHIVSEREQYEIEAALVQLAAARRD